MSKTEKLKEQLNHISKMILFLMGTVFLIIAYAYQNSDTLSLTALIPSLGMILYFYKQQDKKLDQLEDE